MMLRIVTVIVALTTWPMAASAQTVTELVNQGYVLLDSHADDKGTLTMILGNLEGAPEYICITRFSIPQTSDFDSCRKFK